MSEQITPDCQYCGEDAKLIDSSAIYGKSYGPVWACQPCQAYVGCHPNTTIPLGTLANAQLREWRKRTHAVLDPLWKSGRMTRKGVYRSLEDAMGLQRGHAHVAWFDVEQCKEAIEVCEKLTEIA